MNHHPTLEPQIFSWAPDQPLDSVMVSLSNVQRKVAVRITGGCANMSEADAAGVSELFVQAFDGFNGALLIGGTRTHVAQYPEQVVFGITELGPRIRRANPHALVLGVVPRLDRLHHRHNPSRLEVNHLIGEARTNPGYTVIIHPDQDLVLCITKRIEHKGEIWDDEIRFCAYVTETLRTHGKWQSVLVIYNGGGATERELRSVASRGWPVILVRDSGRMADVYASDQQFLSAHPNVLICDKTAASLRQQLIATSALPHP